MQNMSNIQQQHHHQQQQQQQQKPFPFNDPSQFASSIASPNAGGMGAMINLASLQNRQNNRTTQPAQG